jgi:DNA repair protein RadA/Sms
MTGTRCILVEVQALTATGFLGAAKRKCSGLDANRLAMLIAVLEQHAGLRLADRDIFASSVGGLRIAEPASDLALLLAIAGAHYKKALSPATAVVGEVGLGGEVRPVPQLEQRIREAARLGYSRTIVPKVRGAAAKMEGKIDAKVEIVSVATVGRAMEQLG